MKKIYLSFLIFTLLAPACNASIDGYSDPGLLNSQHMKEFNLFERGLKIPQILVDQEKPTPKSYYINTVSFEKNTVFTSEKLTEIVSDKIGTKLNPDDLLGMEKDITQFYRINGYKSTIVTVSDENAEQGTIKFTIYEGPKNPIEPLIEPPSYD